MKKWLKKLFSFWRWFWSGTASYRTIYVEGVQEQLQPQTIYICGEDGQEWFVVFLCPCGCRETIKLSVLPNTKPRWKITKNPNGSISLHPSVWRTKGCKSHFFFKDGFIKWCE